MTPSPGPAYCQPDGLSENVVRKRNTYETQRLEQQPMNPIWISVVVIVIGAWLLRESTRVSVEPRRLKQVAWLLGPLLVLFACMVIFQFGPRDFRHMADFLTYTEDRHHVEHYIANPDSIPITSHLALTVLRSLDQLFGETVEGAQRSFLIFSFGVGVFSLLAVLAFCFSQQFSLRSVRYFALCVLAPSTIFYFGFREIGYAALSLAAYPLVATGLKRDGGGYGLEFGAILFGLAAAMDGIGYVGIIGGFCMILLVPDSDGASDLGRAGRIRLSTRFLAYALAASLGWLLIDLIILHYDIVPYHAKGIPWRRFFEGYIAEERWVSPIFSGSGLLELTMGALATGMPILLLPWLAGARDRTAAWQLWVFSAPGLVFYLFFWPAHGMHADIDDVYPCFPGIFAGLWYATRSKELLWRAAVVLVLGHLGFQFLFGNEFFEHVLIR